MWVMLGVILACQPGLMRMEEVEERRRAGPLILQFFICSMS